MGARHSSSNSNKDASISGDGGGDKSLSRAVAPLQHPIVLSGLSGSGRSSVQAALGLSSGRVVRPDMRFLTVPALLDGEDSSVGYEFMMQSHRSMRSSKKQKQGSSSSAPPQPSPFLYGGRGTARVRWQVAAGSTRALVFVVDSTNPARLVPPANWKPLPAEFVTGFSQRSATEREQMQATLEAQLSARDLLHNLLHKQRGNARPLLVLANKQDVDGALTPAELCDLLDLHSIKGRDWRISGCSAQTGEGLADAVDWLNYVVAHPSLNATPRSDGGFSRDTWREYNARREAAEQRLAKLDRGLVLRAPPLFKTDGSTWQATAEQKATFVVADVTDPDDEEVKAKAAAEAQQAQEAEVSQLESVLQSLAEQTDVDAKTKESLVEETPSPAATTDSESSSDDESLAPALPFPVALARDVSASDSDSDVSSQERESLADPVSFHAPTVTHTPELEHDTEPELTVHEEPDAEHSEQLKLQPLPREKEVNKNGTDSREQHFSSVSSSALVLPPSSEIPRGPMELRKKHWYSRRKQLLPVKDDEFDINERVERFSSFLFF